jgi:hypothetical protein
MASEAEEIEFDENESPTRRSGVVLARAHAREVARETEALFAQLDAIVHIAVSLDELVWFPLGSESSAIVAAADGRATMKVVLERAGLSISQGMPHLGMLIAMGLVVLQREK